MVPQPTTPLFFLFFIGLLLSGCREKNASPATSFDQITLAATLAQADTLPAEKVFEIAKTLPDGTVQDSFYMKLVQKKMKQVDAKALWAHGGFYQKLRGGHPGPEIYLAKIWGSANFIETKIPAAKTWFQTGLQRAEAARDTAQITFFLRWVANSEISLGNFGEAAQHSFRASQLLATTADPVQTAEAHLQMSEILVLNKEYEKAAATGLLAVAAFQKTGDTEAEAYAYFKIASALENTDDYLRAVDYFDKAIEIHKKQPNPTALSGIYGKVANFWLNHNEYPKAIKAVEEAIFWNQKTQARANDGSLENLMGKVYAQKGDQIEAKKHLLAALEIGKQHKNPQVENSALNLLYKLCKKANQPVEALSYYESFVAKQDSLFSKEKQKTISELNIKYETAEKEKQLAGVESQRKIEQSRAIVLVLSLLMALGLAFALIVWQRGRRRILEQEKQLLESEKNLLESEKELAESQAILHEIALENAHSDLKSTKEELETTANLLALKSQVIEELELRFSNQNLAPSESGPPSTTSTENLRGLKILTDRDWSHFRHRFEQNFPGFIDHLKFKFPALSAAEIRLFLLVKLKFDKIEIADTLGISIESVWKSRFRLKKKLEMPDGDDLDDYVRAFA